MLRSLPRRAVTGRPAQALAPPMESWRCFPRGVNLTARCYSSTDTRRALFRQSIQHWRKVRGSFFAPSEEVKQARVTNTPIVGLETTIYTHGFPYPDNVKLALDLEQIVRDNGGVPATIGVLDGQIRVGMTTSELKRLASTAGDPETRKVSRRDIPYIVGMGLAGRKLNGGTTIAGTMHICASAGIKVFGTGGLGGVHRDGQNTMDVSADLTE
ncbi:hypothetical protein HYALB_00013119 [Hymenoscyphus albidus]|uniref:Uncharacterized protein n=1 Tax=Hymenoscyphus albidus TaxID=595503 RepID=A0A9N9LTK0_9HELO|nr:hypothetical protein HYALB_00013119 [Hymenoscyphus albidus]